MPKTYDQIQSQIHKLQREADALKAKEIADVVSRMRKDIAHYGLMPDDLFGKPVATVVRKPAGKRAAKAANTTKAIKASKATKPVKAAKPAKSAAAVKFQDQAGNRWSGVGKRPNWFKAALAAGKSADELLVKPAI